MIALLVHPDVVAFQDSHLRGRRPGIVTIIMRFSTWPIIVHIVHLLPRLQGLSQPVQAISEREATRNAPTNTSNYIVQDQLLDTKVDHQKGRRLPSIWSY